MDTVTDYEDRQPCSCGHVSVIHHRRRPHPCMDTSGCLCGGFSLAPDDIQHTEDHDNDAIGGYL